MKEIDSKKKLDIETKGQRGHYANRYRLIGSNVTRGMNREVEKWTKGHYANRCRLIGEKNE